MCNGVRGLGSGGLGSGELELGSQIVFTRLASNRLCIKSSLRQVAFASSRSCQVCSHQIVMYPLYDGAFGISELLSCYFTADDKYRIVCCF